jgi:hypothetical protein
MAKPLPLQEEFALPALPIIQPGVSTLEMMIQGRNSKNAFWCNFS